MAIIFLDDFFVVVNAYILMQKPLVIYCACITIITVSLGRLISDWRLQ